MTVQPIIPLAAATVLSTGGTRLSAIAIPWLVLTTTGSPVLTGLVGLAELLPYVLAKALGGPLIDRIGARRIAVWCDSFSTLAIVLVPLLFWVGLLSIWVLLPVVALVGVLRAPSDAAKQAMVPMVAAMGQLPLERVTGIMGASDRLAGTLGAAAAGGLIALLGPAPALLVNAAAFLLSATVVGFGIKPRPAAAPRRDPATSYRAELGAGWAVLRNDPVLRGLVVMIAITNLFDQAYGIVLLPVWVRSAGLDVTWVGIFLAAFSGASIAGATIAAAIGHRLPRLLVYTVGFFFAGPLPMAIFALNAPIAVIVGVLMVSGLAAGFSQPHYRRHSVRTHLRRHGGQGHCPVRGFGLGADAVWRALCRPAGRPFWDHVGAGRDGAALSLRDDGPPGSAELSPDGSAGSGRGVISTAGCAAD